MDNGVRESLGGSPSQEGLLSGDSLTPESFPIPPELWPGFLQDAYSSSDLRMEALDLLVNAHNELPNGLPEIYRWDDVALRGKKKSESGQWELTFVCNTRYFRIPTGAEARRNFPEWVAYDLLWFLRDHCGEVRIDR